MGEGTLGEAVTSCERDVLLKYQMSFFAFHFGISDYCHVLISDFIFSQICLMTWNWMVEKWRSAMIDLVNS